MGLICPRKACKTFWTGWEDGNWKPLPCRTISNLRICRLEKTLGTSLMSHSLHQAVGQGPISFCAVVMTQALSHLDTERMLDGSAAERKICKLWLSRMSKWPFLKTRVAMRTHRGIRAVFFVGFHQIRFSKESVDKVGLRFGKTFTVVQSTNMLSSELAK